MTDDELISQFEKCLIPNDSFRHADHVRTAFLYICRYPATEAIERFSASLRRFAAAHGKPDRYNETITWAFLFLIRERIVRAGSAPTWLEFAEGNPDLLNWSQNILGKYYRAETLTSELAKRVFLFPDKL